MKLLKLITAALLLMMLVLVLPTGAVLAQAEEDWAVDMSITMYPLIGDVGAPFGFGARDGATDEFDPGWDDVAPPAPPGGDFRLLLLSGKSAIHPEASRKHSRPRRNDNLAAGDSGHPGEGRACTLVYPRNGNQKG